MRSRCGAPAALGQPRGDSRHCTLARHPHTTRAPLRHARRRAECLATLIEQFEQGTDGSSSSTSVGGGDAAGALPLSPREEAALELSPLVPSAASPAAASSAAGAAGTASSAPPPPSPPRPSAYLISHSRRFEVADLFSFFLGGRARVVYVAVLSGYMYGALWAYGTVFASSFAANVPVAFFNGGQPCAIQEHGAVNAGCLGTFYTWLGAFALLAVPLACMELTEQISVQVLMFGARLLVVLLMVGTVLSGWASCPAGSVVFAGLPSAANATSAAAGAGAISGSALPASSLFDATGLAGLLPVATYAFIFHHSVPVLAHPVAHKASLPSLFAASFAVCCLAYGALGLIVSLGFGEAINQQCNLNWKDYVGCVAPAPGSGEGSVTPASASPLALGVRFIVLIFPALDVLSAYPLNAITLGNNLQAACMGGSGGSGSQAAGEGAEEAEGGALAPGGASSSSAAAAAAAGQPPSLLARCLPSAAPAAGSRGALALRTAFRLLAAVPPILAGALSTASGIDLDQILRWTGLIGVAIAFLIPALLRAAAYARSRAVHAALGAKGGASAASLRAALTRPLTLRELLLDEPAGGAAGGGAGVALRDTPYTSWSVSWRLWGGLRGDGAMFLFALGMAGYVFWGLLSTR